MTGFSNFFHFPSSRRMTPEAYKAFVAAYYTGQAQQKTKSTERKS